MTLVASAWSWARTPTRCSRPTPSGEIGRRDEDSSRHPLPRRFREGPPLVRLRPATVRCSRTFGREEPGRSISKTRRQTVSLGCLQRWCQPSLAEYATVVWRSELGNGVQPSREDPRRWSGRRSRRRCSPTETPPQRARVARIRSVYLAPALPPRLAGPDERRGRSARPTHCAQPSCVGFLETPRRSNSGPTLTMS